MEAAARRKETIRPTTAPRPVPTLGQTPSAWAVPVGLVGLPVAVLLLMVGLAGVRLGWIWSQDAWEAGQLSDRLLRAEGPASAEEFEALGLRNEPNAAWWASTASHLFLWALMAHQWGPDAEPGEQARTFLGAARQAAPLQSSVRFAQAHARPGEGPAPRDAAAILGLSRDVIALAWAGHALLEEGKTDAGLDAYRAALEMATRADPARAAPPTFLDDPQVRRYTLPHEDLIGRIVREMADRPEWTFAQWSAALPRFGVAPVAAYRVLRERGSPDAEKALDLLLSNVDTPPPPDVTPAVLLAAEAEALALRGQWSAAEQRYQSAIAQMPSDRIRRSWWMNLADIYLRLNDDAQKRAAWEAAKGPDPDEEITQRAIQALRQDGGAEKDADRSSRGFSPIEKP
jgi:tetratricopeptide (TPR) repeat protein